MDRLTAHPIACEQLCCAGHTHTRERLIYLTIRIPRYTVRVAAAYPLSCILTLPLLIFSRASLPLSLLILLSSLVHPYARPSMLAHLALKGGPALRPTHQYILHTLIISALVACVYSPIPSACSVAVHLQLDGAAMRLRNAALPHHTRGEPPHGGHLAGEWDTSVVVQMILGRWARRRRVHRVHQR